MVRIWKAAVTAAVAVLSVAAPVERSSVDTAGASSVVLNSERISEESDASAEDVSSSASASSHATSSAIDGSTDGS